MKCCICDKEIEKKYTIRAGKKVMYWDMGENAEPVVKDGRCCMHCNDTIVIPERIKQYRGE